MSQEFSRVKVSTNKRSSIDLSHDQVTSTDFGKLIPICVRECLPDDDISLDPRVFIRLAPLAVPTFGRIKARVHTFFVPNRILWKGWDRWITGTSNVSLPYFTTQSLAARAVLDPAFVGYITSTEDPYSRGQITDLFTNLGISQDAVHAFADQSKNFQINPFPFLAYQRIWFDYFRDSNLNQDEAWFDQFKNHDYGQYSAQLIDQIVQLRRVCFKKDYFTTAKLNPQDGSSAASVNVNVDRGYPYPPSSNPNTLYVNSDGLITQNSVSQTPTVLSSSTGISVSALRAATALQRYLERNNFVGARAISRFLAHFGIAPSAERLDMAEYIDGYDFPVQISDVTSTGIRENTGSGLTTSGLGTQAGKGIAAGNSNTIKYKAKEHGILMSVLSILPDTGYYQGLPKMFSRGFMGDGKFEYYTPEFENLGFQPILKREILANTSDPEAIFGYTPKYADYKFQNDVLAGDLVARGTNTGTDSYHLFRRVVEAMLPLSATFTQLTFYNQQQYDRIFQVPGTGTSAGIDHFFVNVSCMCTMVRNMSSFTAPSIINSEEGDGQRVDLPYGGIRL